MNAEQLPYRKPFAEDLPDGVNAAARVSGREAQPVARSVEALSVHLKKIISRLKRGRLKVAG